jgi:hypothetical protein
VEEYKEEGKDGGRKRGEPAPIHARACRQTMHNRDRLNLYVITALNIKHETRAQTCMSHSTRNVSVVNGR